MRNLLIVVLVLALAASAGARSIEGSYVTLLSPGSISPGETYMFEFEVYNASTDTEWLTEILITFPDGYIINEGSMAFDEIAAGRPSFDMFVPDGPTAIWSDNDGGYGEIYGNEYCYVRVEATVANQLYGIPIYWCLKGDIWGDPPHEVCGCFEIEVSPVEEQSWTNIKAMFR